ncbi:MAG: DsrE family protein [Candidatus Bathyarchaeia archaeon]
MAKTLTILLFAGPYSSQYADITCKLAEKALEKGHKVNLFLYMDGVHMPKKGQLTKKFPNIEEHLKQLVSKGLNVKSCVRCASARGYVEGAEDIETGTFPTTQYIAGVTITELYEFPRLILESDKVISLGD